MVKAWGVAKLNKDGRLSPTFGTNLIFFVTKILSFVDEIFRWKTLLVTKFYFKENFRRQNKIFVMELLVTDLGR